MWGNRGAGWSILRLQVIAMYRRMTVLLSLSFCGALLNAQTATPPSRANLPEDTCTVSGTVFRSADNTPLKNAIIELILDGDQEHAIATRTTAEGQFRLKNLPAGQYEFYVSRNGYVTAQYGQKKPTDPGSKLWLHPGQPIQDLVFRLQRAAVIAGRVFDEEGEPMAGVAVMAMRQSFYRGKKRLRDAGSSDTNDLGEYRIYGLGPGRYYLSANAAEGGYAVGEKQYSESLKAGPEKAYTRLYYPGTSDMSRASTVQVKEAEEVSSVDFLMKEQLVVRVSGRIVSVFTKDTGRNYFDVRLLPKNQSELFSHVSYSASRVHRDGTFELPDVIPGEYTVTAMQFNEQMHSTEQDLEVGNTDVEGLLLVIGAGSDVHGTVVWEGKRSVEKDGLTVMVAGPGLEFRAGGNALVDKNSQFVWKDLPDGQFRVDVEGMGKDGYVREIKVGETPADGNVVKLNRNGGEVKITLSSHGARVSGTVLTAENLPASNAWAVAVRENSWMGKKAWAVTTDQNGHYDLQGLPPGSYRFYCWQDLEEGSWEDSDVLKEYEEKGISIEVQDGDAKAVDLNLIELKDAGKQGE